MKFIFPLLAILLTLGREIFLPARLFGLNTDPDSSWVQPSEGRDSLIRFESTHQQMGSPFKIVCYASDSQAVNQAMAAVWIRIDEMNRILSDYDPESELSAFNRTSGKPGWQAIGPDLYYALAYGKRLSRKTNGTFDPTIGPLVRVWRRAFNQGVLPSDSAIAAARSLVGYQHLKLRFGNRAKLELPGMRVDPGAYVKGWAADEGLELLAKAGFTRALVDAGGKLAIGNPPPGKPGWEVIVQGLGAELHPEDRTLVLSNVGIATSGDAYRYLDIDGVRYSHVLNPKTGMGLSHAISVSVIAKNGLDADTYATALSIMEPEQAIAYADQHKHLQVQVIVRTPTGQQQLQNHRFQSSNSAFSH